MLAERWHVARAARPANQPTGEWVHGAPAAQAIPSGDLGMHGPGWMVVGPMWTIVQFALRRDDDYDPAFEILANAGFQPHRKPERVAEDPFPAAVVGDVFHDPAVITRAVFGGLYEAGLLPVAVAACHVDVAGAAAAPRALARP